MSDARRQHRSLVRRALVLNSDDIGRRIVTGAGYKVLGIALRTLITIGSTAVLARLLLPADFGYVAMATVVTEFAALFGSFGFTNVLIQRRVITRLQLDTVFWATIGVGTVLGGVVFILSFFAGWLFSDAKVGELLRVLCITFVLNSMTAVPWVVLSRLLRFRTEFWAQIVTVVARTAVAIGCAYAGWGVWSLVAGAIAGAAVAVVVDFACVPYWPRLRFHRALLVQTWRTSSSYFGGTMLYYVSMNLDLLLIGRSLGASPLGYYQNARSLTDEIRARIAMPIQHVLFPAFSAVRGETDRMHQLVLRAARSVSAVVMPIGFGVSANASELVRVLYGEHWRPMIPVMLMFGLSAAVRAATAIATPLFNASDRVGLSFRYNIIGTVLTVGGVLAAMPYGIGAVATTVAATSLYSLVSFRAGLRLIGLGTSAMMQILGPPGIASSALWLWTALLRRSSWLEGLPAGSELAIQVISGAIVYLVALALLSRVYLSEMMLSVSVILKRH